MLKYYTISGLYTVAVLSAILFFSADWLQYAIIIICTIGYVSLTVWGSACIQSQMFVKTFNSNTLASNKVALTFDDGPHVENTPKLLEILNQYKAKASFFLIGANIAKHPEIAKRIVAEGHLIGNHSYYHGNLFSLQLPRAIKKEIQQTQTEIEHITQHKNCWFRPPYGVTNPLISLALSKLNLKVIGWSLRSFDTGNKTKELILKQIIDRIKGGDIILLHDKTEHVCWLTQEILIYLKNNNLKAVTVEELLFD
jgi:peptidoglycan/xylan/chitin deacetylase (PgdA/CDA1 family)